MKTTYKFLSLLTVGLALLGFTLLQQEQSYEELIQGTWVSEGNTFDYRWVFSEDNTVIRYSENQIYKSFTWQISPEPTPSGLTISYLILTNSEDPDDKYEYQIVGISSEEMRLQYQREGWGPGKITLYIKQ